MKYVLAGNINTGNVIPGTRNAGTSIGSINEGHYTTNNGHTAYVITNNATCLIILLSPETYFIFGTGNTKQEANFVFKEVIAISF